MLRLSKRELVLGTAVALLVAAIVIAWRASSGVRPLADALAGQERPSADLPVERTRSAEPPAAGTSEVQEDAPAPSELPGAEGVRPPGVLMAADIEPLSPTPAPGSESRPPSNANGEATDELDDPSSCFVFVGHLPAHAPRLDSCGASLAMDGDLLVVGDCWPHSPYPRPVRIHRREGDAWTVEGVLENDSDESRRILYGTTVDVSGARVALTSWRLDKSSWIDEFLVYARDGDGAWLLEADLRADGPWELPPDADPFARRPNCHAATLALDGDRLAVLGNVDGHYNGVCLRMFEGGDGGWRLADVQVLFEGPEWVPMALDLRGERLAVGARSLNRWPERAGSVVTFRRGDNGWREERRWIQPSGQDPGQFGVAVRLLPDGVVVGSPVFGRIGEGAVWRLVEDGASFAVTDVLRSPPRVGTFGAALAVEGEWLAVGAPGAGEGAVLGYRLGEWGASACARWDGASSRAGWGLELALAGGWLAVGTMLVADPRVAEGHADTDGDHLAPEHQGPERPMVTPALLRIR